MSIPVTPPPARWTPAKQRIFLAALLEVGCVAAAARAAGMSPASAHRLRRRLAGTRFDGQWTVALQAHARRLADPFGSEAMPERRAPVTRPTRADDAGVTRA